MSKIVYHDHDSNSNWPRIEDVPPYQNLPEPESRRFDIRMYSPAELAIHNAMQEVEKLPADTELTEAILKLTEALAHVQSFVIKQENHGKETIQRD